VHDLSIIDQYARRVPDPGLGQLTLTIGKYYRINGGSTQHRGVLPDIELPSTIDAERVGESSRDRALPWDQINATTYDARPPLDSEIAYLTRSYNDRIETDANIDYLLSNIEAANEMRSKAEISLNKQARISERELTKTERLARENKRRSANGLEVVESLETLDEEQPDILLDEAIQITSEFIKLENDRKPMLSSVGSN
ncbi:MAG: carboxy terminal-processing peptidase, partial [Gammaproteobacteria bacterium]|nr:carboxy terminal-processing peptidase [Gammaproteobacteria bacterium]